MRRAVLHAITLLALTGSAIAQAQNIRVDLTPGVVHTTQYGKQFGSTLKNDNVEKVNYIFDTLKSYRITMSAKLYDNNFQGTYGNPGEIDIRFNGFTLESGGFMPAKKLGYRDFAITGTITSGTTVISVMNSINSSYRWGIKDVLVTLVEPLIPQSPAPYIPPTNFQPIPFASTVNVYNVCEQPFVSNDVSAYAELPLTILEYAEQIMAETEGYPLQVDRDRFLDYVKYVERVTGVSYLRQSIGENYYVMGLPMASQALMQIPGEIRADQTATEHYWCPASCPSGYTQSAIQCDFDHYVDFDSGFHVIDEGAKGAGFNWQYVCGYLTPYVETPSIARNGDLLYGIPRISTSLSCTRDVETYNYREVQETPAWTSND